MQETNPRLWYSHCYNWQTKIPAGKGLNSTLHQAYACTVCIAGFICDSDSGAQLPIHLIAVLVECCTIISEVLGSN